MSKRNGTLASRSSRIRSIGSSRRVMPIFTTYGHEIDDADHTVERANLDAMHAAGRRKAAAAMVAETPARAKGVMISQDLPLTPTRWPRAGWPRP